MVGIKGMKWGKTKKAKKVKGKGQGWHGDSRRHWLARMGINTVLPDGRRLPVDRFIAMGKREPDFSKLWKLDMIKNNIEGEMFQYNPEDIELDDGYMIWVETISSGASGTYQPNEIADFFDLELPKDAKDFEGNKAKEWRDYEFGWEHLLEISSEHDTWINKNSRLKGTLILMHAEDGDYGLAYIFDEGDHPTWDKQKAKAKRRD